MLVMMVVMVLARVEGQLVVSEENETECGEGECLVISKCPAVLKLVFKVRTPGFVLQSVQHHLNHRHHHHHLHHRHHHSHHHHHHVDAGTVSCLHY